MGLRFVILIIILFLNGFFAAAEVSLVSVRQSRLRELAQNGQAGASVALSLLASPGRLLSVTQVGVTLASLGLGWAGEDTIFELLLKILTPLHLPMPEVALHGVSFAIAFLLISYAHVMVGEVVPKNLAIQKADRVAIFTAPVLLIFYRLASPFVIVIERSSALVLRILGLRGDHEGGGHSAEELKFIVQTSRTAGHLEKFQEDAIQRLIQLSEYSAREIMKPRNAVVALSIDADFDQVVSIIAEHKYSRFPVYEDRPEHVIGIVHYKDLMRIFEEQRFAHERRRVNRPFRLRRFLRKGFYVPETKPLNQLIDEFRTLHTHMALVVDEFGTFTGLLTLEDVLEQVFGEFADEREVKEAPTAGLEKVLQLNGATTIRDLENRYAIYLPGEVGFETLAGFLLYKFGFIPGVRDSIEYSGRRYTITEMDRNRIAKVLIEKIDAESVDPVNEG